MLMGITGKKSFLYHRMGVTGSDKFHYSRMPWSLYTLLICTEVIVCGCPQTS